MGRAPILILLVIVSTACNRAIKDENLSIAPNNLAMEKNVALVQTYFAHFNNHDWGKMAEMYAETAKFKDPSFGPEIVEQTREQIIRKYSEMHELFPDIHDEVTALYPSEDKHIIVEFVSSGTAPDNFPFKLPVCTIFTIEQGLITHDFTYYNDFE